MSVAEELDKLKKMRDDGTITDEQYERAKAKVLDEGASGADLPLADEVKEERDERRPRRRDRDEDEDEYERSPRLRKKKVREWCMLVHLSLLAGHMVPLAGLIAPIVIWQVKKDEMPEIDEHGKNAINWLISFVIYMAISAVLVLVIVGIVLLIVVGILGIVFPIIAGLKANEGKVWKYPLAIPFFK